MAYRWVYVAEPDRHQWVLRRNCALTPGQLGGWFGTLAGLSLAIAGVSAAQGAWVVVPFALVEVAALAGAFLAYGRHAGDYERIVATRERVLVERRCGARIDRIEGESARVRVEYGGSTHGQIRLVTGHGQIAIGRFVPDDRKAELARELRGALGGWPAR
ncbi:MAG: DUF2244 domain-containing protein [Burkholderiaceae bacterium]|nr:DUF2244 domain-containing protein [Burkholderiaceae bacterium]